MLDALRSSLHIPSHFIPTTSFCGGTEVGFPCCWGSYASRFFTCTAISKVRKGPSCDFTHSPQITTCSASFKLLKSWFSSWVDTLNDLHWLRRQKLRNLPQVTESVLEPGSKPGHLAPSPLRALSTWLWTWNFLKICMKVLPHINITWLILNLQFCIFSVQISPFLL